MNGKQDLDFWGEKKKPILTLLFCDTHFYSVNSLRQMWEMFQFHFCAGPLPKTIKYSWKLWLLKFCPNENISRRGAALYNIGMKKPF